MGTLTLLTGPVILATCSCGLSLNLLARRPPRAQPYWLHLYDSEQVWAHFQLDLEVDGTFFAPFWGLFDLYYSPDDLAEREDASLVTPIFLWFYLLIALVLFVNLLIAMFNERYREVNKHADFFVRELSVHMLSAYFVQYPFPPPINVPVLFVNALYTGVKKAVYCVGRCWYSQQQRWPTICRLDECWKNATLEPRPEHNLKHYPKSLEQNFKDSLVEQLVKQARQCYLRRLRFENWKTEDMHRHRFETLETKIAALAEQNDKILNHLTQPSAGEQCSRAPSSPTLPYALSQQPTKNSSQLEASITAPATKPPAEAPPELKSAPTKPEVFITAPAAKPPAEAPPEFESAPTTPPRHAAPSFGSPQTLAAALPSNTAWKDRAWQYSARVGSPCSPADHRPTVRL